MKIGTLLMLDQLHLVYSSIGEYCWGVPKVGNPCKLEIADVSDKIIGYSQFLSDVIQTIGKTDAFIVFRDVPDHQLIARSFSEFCLTDFEDSEKIANLYITNSEMEKSPLRTPNHEPNTINQVTSLLYGYTVPEIMRIIQDNCIHRNYKK